MSNADELAFSCEGDTKYMSLTKREHAAILLRVPQSGDDEIDAMIREANRRDAAAMAMQGILSDLESMAFFEKSSRVSGYRAAIVSSVQLADALIAELERTA